MWDLNSPIQGVIPHLRWEVVKLDYEGSPVRILKSWFSCITQVIFSWITTIRKETCSNVFCFKKQNKKSFWLLSCFSAPLHCKPPWKHCLWSLLQSSPIFSSTCSNRFHPHDSIETALIKVSSELHPSFSFGAFWNFLAALTLLTARSTPSLKLLCLLHHSTPGIPVHHQLPEFTQTHVHRVVMPPSHLILCLTFSFCPQSLPASRSFPMSQLFTSGGQSIGVSASTLVLPMNTHD